MLTGMLMFDVETGYWWIYNDEDEQVAVILNGDKFELLTTWGWVTVQMKADGAGHWCVYPLMFLRSMMEARMRPVTSLESP